MRFYHLGSPKAVIFDETYYAKDGVGAGPPRLEVNWDKNANDLILQHNGHIAIPSERGLRRAPPRRQSTSSAS